MNAHASRLPARLVALQLAMHALAFTLSAAFAPRVLLLEPAAGAAALAVIGVTSLLLSGFSLATTTVLMRRARAGLRALAVGSTAVAPRELLALDAAPGRLAFANALFATLVSLLVVAPPLRPQALDLYTALALMMLVLTIVSTASLPAYVMMRVAVARAIELAAPSSTQDAIRLLGRGVLGRVRRRFVAAVAAPVAFVALGASLLVDAQARAFDRDARAADALDVARAAFEPLQIEGWGAGSADVEARGQAEAIDAARALGYRITIDPKYAGDPVIQHAEGDETQVIVPIQRGAAVVRFEPLRLSPIAAAYALLAVVAVALAAILGTRIGAAFESDIALATREIRRAGVAEVMRGTIILHEARFANVRSLLLEIDGLGGIFREFAGAQQRAIEAREANERMRGLLLASMSHDLKAPLNAVLGFAELVGRNELSDGQYESLAIIEQRGRELLMLIDTILDSARVEAGELEVSPEPTHVGDVVMASVLDARTLAIGTDVQIKGEIQPGVPMLLVDPTRIVQALTAVVMTAVRFSHKGIVPVRATLPEEGTRLRVEVETSGEGLPMAERKKIFDAFKSAESARRQGGLGLGLQLARSIVEIHGGSIEVDSTEGGGMVFRVWLPVAGDVPSIRARASKPSLPV